MEGARRGRADAWSGCTGVLEPEVVLVVPRGDSSTRRGRVRVRGGSNRASVALGLSQATVAVPRGGTGRAQGMREGRGTGSDSDRTGPRTIEELPIYDIADLPAGQGLESPLHPRRKRQWIPSAPAPRPAPPPPSPPFARHDRRGVRIGCTGELEPEVVMVVPRGGSSTRRGRVRVRGGSNRASVALGLGQATVAVPRGGMGRVQGVRGGRGTGSDRSGPRTIEELPIYDIVDLPAGQGLESPLHPRQKRQWIPSAPAPRSAPPPRSPAFARRGRPGAKNGCTGELEPEVVMVVPHGDSRPRRGRVRVRGGSNRASVALGLGQATVAVPRGGTGRVQGVRGERGTGSDRSGSRTIKELSIYEITDLPAGQGLESPLHPRRKRQWKSSAPAPRPAPPPPPPQVAQDVVVEVHPPSPPKPQMGQVVVEDVPPPSPPPPPSPAVSVKCESESSMDSPRLIDSLRDPEISHQFHYGSESDSSESDDDVMAPFSILPRAQRSIWDTPIDIDDADVKPGTDTPAPAPASAPTDASTSSILDVPPSATDRPWGLYEFDWKPFPNVPIPPESRREVFSHNDVGPTAPCVDPYEIFLGIWDRQFMEYIASETNRYAQQVAASMLETNNLHPNSRINKWHDTNADELYVYFGVVIAMGVVVKSRVMEYWNATPDVFYTPGFGAHMSGFRFELLSKCLHFVNNETMCALELDSSEAKLFKVQPLLSHLNNKFQSLYRLGQNIALDESLLQWKGLLDINQFIRNKAASVGIKTYEICESQTGYLWRFEVHGAGKSQRSQPQQFEDPMKATTPAIVLRLTHGLEGKGHTLWMDNFYNSPCLARHLKTLGFDCVGTLRTNRKFVPQALHSLTKGDMRQGQITGLTSGDVDVMVWRDNNRVGMISTYHGNGVSHTRDSIKPILIHDYNIMMGGVDKKDQMLAMFPIERKRTKVWYKKLFRRLLNVSILNAYIIHRKSFSSSHLTHRNFRICLVKSLFSKHCSPTFLSATSPILHQNTGYDARFHRLAEYPFGSTKATHQRRRRKCVNDACRKLVQTYCVGCSKTMCMDACFLALHQ